MGLEALLQPCLLVVRIDSCRVLSNEHQCSELIRFTQDTESGLCDSAIGSIE